MNNTENEGWKNMRKVKMKLLEIREIAKDTIEMKLTDNYITEVAKPGQFISIALPNHTLPRPISIANIDRNKQELTLLFKIMGKGTDELAGFIPGAEIDCFGPNGNSFPLRSGEMTKVLLIGGGIGVPPLYYLGKQLKKQGGIKIVSILGFQSSEYVFYEKEFASLGETFIVTDDGSYGMKGFVTDAVTGVPSFNAYYACGPTGMLRALTTQLHNKTGYISLEERMGCTVGACAACVIPTTEGGYKKICHDGPVFAAEEVIL